MSKINILSVVRPLLAGAMTYLILSSGVTLVVGLLMVAVFVAHGGLSFYAGLREHERSAGK